MAKKGKKKGGRKRGGKKTRTVKKAPKTIKGVFKQQPLLVKGGMALTAMKMATEPAGPYGASIAEKILLIPTDKSQAMAAVKEVPYALMKLENYYPVVVGVIGHKAAKMLGVKGL